MDLSLSNEQLKKGRLDKELPVLGHPSRGDPDYRSSIVAI